MKSVVLSTTEAEYVAVSEVVKELKFVIQVLQSMEIKVQLPIKVHVDNVGAIWLANNKTTNERTKHVDIRAHFVREYTTDGIVEIVFVRSADNDSDILTKNLAGELFHKHERKLIWTVKEMNNEEEYQRE
jgi:intein-encoded DNA endonuclease-like protein